MFFTYSKNLNFLRFGFVEFESDENCKAAKEAMEDCEIDGRKVTVAFAKQKGERGRPGARGGSARRAGGKPAGRGAGAGRGGKGNRGGNTESWYWYINGSLSTCSEEKNYKDYDLVSE